MEKPQEYPIIFDKDVAQDKAVMNLLIATLDLDLEKQLLTLEEKINLKFASEKWYDVMLFCLEDNKWIVGKIAYKFYEKVVHMDRIINSNALFNSDFFYEYGSHLFHEDINLLTKKKIPFLGVFMMKKFIEYCKQQWTTQLSFSSLGGEKLDRFYLNTLKLLKKSNLIKDLSARKDYFEVYF